jgi:hypothetical protein
MQQPGPSPRRDWVIIGGLITVVAVSWVGFFVYWMLRKPAASQPAAPQVAVAPATQAARPTAVVVPRPLLVQPTPPVPPQTQPAPQVNARDAALLEALQRSEELKNQGKSREALAELQRALQTGSSGAASQPDQQDPQAQLRDLLGKAGSSTQPADNDALLSAALQVLSGSVGQTVGFVDDLDAEMSGRRKAPKPQLQAQARPPAQAEIVAYVYGEPVTRDEIGGGESPSEVSIIKLNQRILEPLLETYGRNQGIKATSGEVAVYQTRVNRKPPVPPTPGRRPQGRPTPPPMDPAAEAAVIRWKVTKSLYEQYHGTVILGRNDRLEPVGAYREFLKDQEAKAAFRIEDSKYRDRFWAYYDRDFGPQAVPPEKVNFGTPWWQKATGGGQ